MNDTQLKEMTALLSLYLNNPDSLETKLRLIAQAEMLRRRERIARNNQRFEKLLSQVSDKQANAIMHREGNGYKVNQVFFNKRRPDGAVAVMMVKDQVFDVESGKVKQKIAVVYADASCDETFAKSIKIRAL